MPVTSLTKWTYTSFLMVPKLPPSMVKLPFTTGEDSSGEILLMTGILKLLY